MSIAALSIFSRLWYSSSDRTYWGLQLVSVVLVGATFLVGFFVVRVGWNVNKRQSEELRKERAARAEMEEALAPRVLSTRVGGMDLLAPLRGFEGIQVEIRFAPDIEATRATGQVNFALRELGWQLTSVARDERLGRNMLADGVKIEWYLPEAAAPDASQASIDEARRLETKTENAARAFARFLSQEPNRWKKVKASRPRDRGEVPPNTIRIKIGVKPSPFLPKEVKETRDEIRDWYARAREESAKRRAKRKQERLESRKKEYEAHPPPAWQLRQDEEFDKMFEQREDEWDALEKETEDQL